MGNGDSKSDEDTPIGMASNEVTSKGVSCYQEGVELGCMMIKFN